jgi:hypothetical protein
MTPTARNTPPHSDGAAALDLLRRTRCRWLGPLMLIGATAALAIFAHMLVLTLSSKMDTSFPESQVVERAMAVANGRPLYDDWRHWPHHFAPYGPLHYYPAAWWVRLFGNPAYKQSCFSVGRSISIVFLAGCLVVLWLLGRRIGLSPIWAFAALPLTLHWTSLMQYVVSFRPDAPAACWALLALLAAIGGPARGRRLLAALVFLYLSMWYKPTALGMVIVVALWMRRSLGARRTIAFLTLWGLAGLLPLLAFDRASGGLVLLNLVTSLDNGWTLAAYWHYCVLRLHNPFMVQIVLAAFIAGIGLRRADLSPQVRLLWSAYLFNLAVCLLQLFKYGSDKNYFLIPFLLSTVIVIHGVHGFWECGIPRLRPAVQEAFVWLAIIPYVLWVLTSFLILTPIVGKSIRMTTVPYPIVIEARAWEGPLLTNSPYIALNSLSPPTLLDYVQYGALARRGHIDPMPLLERVRQRRFSRIVLLTDTVPYPENPPPADGPMLGEGFAEALFANYVEAQRMTDFSIFVPKEP